MAQPACGNLNRDEEGRLIDLFTYEPIPLERLITLDINGFLYCYDAYQLFIYLSNQMQGSFYDGEELILPERVPISADHVHEVADKVKENLPAIFKLSTYPEFRGGSRRGGFSRHGSEPRPRPRPQITAEFSSLEEAQAFIRNNAEMFLLRLEQVRYTVTDPVLRRAFERYDSAGTLVSSPDQYIDLTPPSSLLSR